MTKKFVRGKKFHNFKAFYLKKRSCQSDEYEPRYDEMNLRTGRHLEMAAILEWSRELNGSYQKFEVFAIQIT